MELVSNRNAVYRTAYHVVWCPKYRKPILTGHIATGLRKLLDKTCHEREWRIGALEIQPDHVHLFLCLPPSVAIANAVKILKGTTARLLFHHFPAVVLEDLRGIRLRIRARRKQRAVLHSWAFSQLRFFITYKVALAGVLLVLVGPRDTSRECSRCGHIAKENRPNQSTFCCAVCHYSAPADCNAALVIRSRAAVNPPRASARLSDVCSSTHTLVKSL